MSYHYSTITRTLTVFGAKMTHIFKNTGAGEIEADGETAWVNWDEAQEPAND
jgi:hypothetical protein